MGSLKLPKYSIKKKGRKNMREQMKLANKLKTNKGITLIALVITVVLNCSYLAMERMREKQPNILKIC